MKINDIVLGVLSEGVCEGSRYYIRSGQLDRKLYEQVNKVLEASGGKWNRTAKAHLFDGDAGDRLDQILLTGEVTLPKDEFNYFPTPPLIAEQLIGLANVRPGMLVLEPSAGQGALVMPLLDAGTQVVAIELMPANYEVLVALMQRRGGQCIISEGDFLEYKDPPVMFDRVVMNPPFAKQADVRHVLHAMSFVAPGGVLVSIMSGSVLYRDNALTKSFRDQVYARSGKFITLPEGSFKASGTMVNTVIVRIPFDGGAQ